MNCIVNRSFSDEYEEMKKKNLISPPHKPPPKHLARKTLLSYGNSRNPKICVPKLSARHKKEYRKSDEENAECSEVQNVNKSESKTEFKLPAYASGTNSIDNASNRCDLENSISTKLAVTETVNLTRDADNPSELLLETARNDPLLNILTKAGKTLKNENDILAAAESGNIQGVMTILVKGVHPDSCTGLNGYRPLHYAVSRGHINIAERLLFFGATIDVATDDGETPLMLASHKGYHNIVEMLLDKGASADARNNFGETPLFYASRRGFPTVVRLLLERGADSTIESKFKDVAQDDCLDKRTRCAFDDVKTVKPTNGGPAKCLVGRLLLRVMSFLDTKSLCRSAQVNGQWHGKASQKDLWEALGISRWEIAMRQNIPDASSGFVMAPFLSGYRPSSSRSNKSNDSDSRSNSRPSSSQGALQFGPISCSGHNAALSGDSIKDKIAKMPMRAVPGFSTDFLDDEE